MLKGTSLSKEAFWVTKERPEVHNTPKQYSKVSGLGQGVQNGLTDLGKKVAIM